MIHAERLSEVTSKKLAPGQATAIVTGAVSIVIGVRLVAQAFASSVAQLS